MGNWRRVIIQGTCSEEDVPKLQEALDPGENYENFHCLVCGGLAGLPNWASQKIMAVGNLGERDYTVRDVADQLLKLSVTAPSLNIEVHCGGDYEDSKCIKTISLVGGDVEFFEPKIDLIPKISREQINKNLLEQLRN